VVRESTFWGWTNDFVRGSDLAAAGFICLHEKDLVQCFFCRVVVGFWEKNDVPMEEHKKHNPSCPLVQGRALGNISACGSPADRALTSFVRAALADCRDRPTATSRLAADSTAVHPAPRQRSMEERLRSFENTKVAFPPVEKMVAAGFFYLGLGDLAVCGSCGGGVMNWLATDDPFERHADLYPACAAATAATTDATTTATATAQATAAATAATYPERALPSDLDRDLILETRVAQELLKIGLNKELVGSALWRQVESNLFVPSDLGHAIELVYDYEDSL